MELIYLLFILVLSVFESVVLFVEESLHLMNIIDRRVMTTPIFKCFIV